MTFIEVSALEDNLTRMPTRSYRRVHVASMVVGTVRYIRNGLGLQVVQQVGAHRSRRVQVDVVAVNWREKALLHGAGAG